MRYRTLSKIRSADSSAAWADRWAIYSARRRLSHHQSAAPLDLLAARTGAGAASVASSAEYSAAVEAEEARPGADSLSRAWVALLPPRLRSWGWASAQAQGGKPSSGTTPEASC